MVRRLIYRIWNTILTETFFTGNELFGHNEYFFFMKNFLIKEVNAILYAYFFRRNDKFSKA